MGCPVSWTGLSLIKVSIMLKLGKLTDYAIVLLTHCARVEPGSSVTARQLSELSKLPLPTVSKIMKALARSSILASHRGVKGGYSLDRSAGGVSIAEVIRAMEGPLMLTECCGAEPVKLCELEQSCPVRGNWARINDVVVASLERLTIADMTQPGECRQKTTELLRLMGREASPPS